MTMRRPWTPALVLVGWLAVSPLGLADDSPLTLADLEAYRRALETKPTDSAPLVRFRDLWDRPEAFAGRVVTVEGRVARLFRQPALGEFPPLVEAWIVSPSGDPSCLVFPPSESRPTPEVGTTARFSGTFLRRIKYPGGDVARLAPLVVGPRPPSSSADPSEGEGRSWTSIDGTMAIGALLLVGMILARRHLARPFRAPQCLEAPPHFVDGGPGPASAADAEEDSHGSCR